MKGTKRIGIGLVAVCLAAGLAGAQGKGEAAKATYAELCAAKDEAGAARDFAAWAKIGAEILATREAETNAGIMAGAAAWRVIGLQYTDPSSAPAEYDRLRSLVPEQTRVLFSRAVWGHWVSKESGAVTAARLIEDIAEDVAAIQAGQSALSEYDQISVAHVWCGALSAVGRVSDAKEAAEWILEKWGAAAINSDYFAVIATRVGASVSNAVAQVASPTRRAQVEYWVAREQRDTAAANAAVIGVLSREARTLPPRELDAWFARLDPVPMSGVDYLAALQAILKATPATETNAAFLGRVKSELEKMK